MKPSLTFISVLAMLSISVTAIAGSLGAIQLGGNGCIEVDQGKELLPVKGLDHRYSIAQQVSLAKDLSKMIERKTCQFRIPVKLKDNEKLVVSDVSQWVRMSAGKGTDVKMKLEVFLAGTQGHPLTAEIKAVGGLAYSSKTLRDRGVVAESECGKDVILSGNLSAVSTGKGRASAQSGPLQLNLEIVSCE